jgi:tRNA 2-thiouridine synthesizing protein A
VRPEDAELVLDCRLMRCPLPVIELAKHINDVAVGEVLAILADDPAAATDIPAWCRMRGHEYLGTAGPHGTASTHLVRRRRR